MSWAPDPKPEWAPQPSAPKHASQLPPKKAKTRQRTKFSGSARAGHTANVVLAPRTETIGRADADRGDVRHSDPGHIATPWTPTSRTSSRETPTSNATLTQPHTGSPRQGTATPNGTPTRESPVDVLAPDLMDHQRIRPRLGLLRERSGIASDGRVYAGRLLSGPL